MDANGIASILWSILSALVAEVVIALVWWLLKRAADRVMTACRRVRPAEEERDGAHV
uniref:hypothetical protein n=1 Tax=Herbidospora sakaeratensis TaxID=564415 RepID=UPI000B11BD2E|nr:hypothetical protein [Herbidospora sakaeratensis]